MPRFKAEYTEAEKKAFGALLRRLMLEKSLNGAELARRASRHLSPEKPMDRSSISWYLNGRSMPSPVQANALAKALDVDPQIMLPRDHSQKKGEAAGAPPSREKDVRMSLLPGGKMHLMMNVVLPMSFGQEVLKIIMEHGEGA